jgi:hypothetical protein
MRDMESECWRIDVYYRPPRDHHRETELTKQVGALGGRFDYWDEGGAPEAKYICLSYGFDDQAPAELAAKFLRRQGQHLEGPTRYVTA